MRGNLYTCSTFCDGKSTLDEMVKSAINKGFSYIGFSGHSSLKQGLSYCMQFEDEGKYFEEVNFLKEKYKDKIRVLCGLERDFESEDNGFDYEYTIASTHYIKAGA